MHPADDLLVLGQVVGELMAVAHSGVGKALTMRTPCLEWSLGDLLDHVVGGNRFTVAILGGATAEDAMATTVKLFADDRDPFADLGTSSVALEAAFSAVGVLSSEFHHVVGSLLGLQVLRLRLHDLIVHRWDLAQTIKPPALLSPELEAWGMAELEDPDSITVRHFSLDSHAAGMYLQRMGRS